MFGSFEKLLQLLKVDPARIVYREKQEIKSIFSPQLTSFQYSVCHVCFDLKLV